MDQDPDFNVAPVYIPNGPLVAGPALVLRYTNQMRVWELEEIDHMPTGFLTFDQDGNLKVNLAASDCDVDIDPLADQETGIPTIPEWLRTSLIGTLTSVYGGPPRLCIRLHRKLLNGREDAPIPVRNLLHDFTYVTRAMKAVLGGLGKLIASIRHGQEMDPRAFNQGLGSILCLIHAPRGTKLPDEVLCALQDAFEVRHTMVSEDVDLADRMDRLLFRPFQELHQKLEGVRWWAEKVVANHCVCQAGSISATTAADEAADAAAAALAAADPEVYVRLPDNDSDDDLSDLDESMFEGLDLQD